VAAIHQMIGKSRKQKSLLNGGACAVAGAIAAECEILLAFAKQKNPGLTVCAGASTKSVSVENPAYAPRLLPSSR